MRNRPYKLYHGLYFVLQGSPTYAVSGVYTFLQWPKNESMQILIGPLWSKNAGPAALACGAYHVLQVVGVKLSFKP